MSTPTSLRISPGVKRRIAAAVKEAARPDWSAFFREHPPVSLPKTAARNLSTREGFGS